MSLKAMTWVMEDAPVNDATSLLILYALADRANDDGTAAWPSQEWLAKRARCTTRTIRRKLTQLEEEGLIRKGNPKFVEHIRQDRRPTVWDLCLWVTSTTGQNDRPDKMTGRTPGAERPDTPGTTTGHTGSNDRTQLCPTNRPEPSLEPSKNHFVKSEILPGSFDEFWIIYPRSGDKRKSEESWGKAIVQTDPKIIIDGAKKYRDEVADVSRQYVALPTTWLNQRRWMNYVKTSVVERILSSEQEFRL